MNELTEKILRYAYRENKYGEWDENMCNWLAADTEISECIKSSGFSYTYDFLADEDLFNAFVETNYKDCEQAVKDLEEEESQLKGSSSL